MTNVVPQTEFVQSMLLLLNLLNLLYMLMLCMLPIVFMSLKCPDLNYVTNDPAFTKWLLTLSPEVLYEECMVTALLMLTLL